jgi:hypothetical protein
MTSHKIARVAGFLRLVLVVLLSRAAAQAADPKVQKPAACWTHIYYPSVAIPSAPGEMCWILVRSNALSGEPDQKPQLDISAGWSGRDSAKIPETVTEPERMSVRLHLPDGRVLEPHNPFRQMGVISMSGGQSASRVGQFPWGGNVLEEAWFELKIDGRAYWIEVPYGFTRDPMAPLPPAMPEANAAALAPAMAKLGPEDRVVPWSKVDYDLGAIQKGWRLQAEARNDEEHTWFATLYRESAPWDVNETKTWPRIVDDNGARVEAKHIGSRVPDIFRLRHEFSFATYPKDGRSWGTLIVTVNDKPWRVGIPSSLFKAGHAVAGRRHPQGLPLVSQE